MEREPASVAEGRLPAPAPRSALCTGRVLTPGLLPHTGHCLSVHIYKPRGTGPDAPVPPTGRWYRHGMAARSYINISPLVLALEV